MILLQKLHEVVWCWSTGLPSPRRVLQAWIFAAPYQGIALVRLVLPRRLGGYKARTSDLDINQVVAHPTRDKWYTRLGWFVLDPLVSTMFAFLAAFGVAIWRIVRDYERGTTDKHQALRAFRLFSSRDAFETDPRLPFSSSFAVTVLLTIAWPTLLWAEFLFASFVPLCVPPPLSAEATSPLQTDNHASSPAQRLPPLPLSPPHRAARVVPHPGPLLARRAPKAPLQDGLALQGVTRARVRHGRCRRRVGRRVRLRRQVDGRACLSGPVRRGGARAPSLQSPTDLRREGRRTPSSSSVPLVHPTLCIPSQITLHPSSSSSLLVSESCSIPRRGAPPHRDTHARSSCSSRASRASDGLLISLAGR